MNGSSCFKAVKLIVPFKNSDSVGILVMSIDPTYKSYNFVQKEHTIFNKSSTSCISLYFTVPVYENCFRIIMTYTLKSLHKTEFHFNATLLPQDVGIATKAFFLIEKVRCISKILFFHIYAIGICHTEIRWCPCTGLPPITKSKSGICRIASSVSSVM